MFNAHGIEKPIETYIIHRAWNEPTNALHLRAVNEIKVMDVQITGVDFGADAVTIWYVEHTRNY